jgi:hypothetical protein
VTVTDIQFLIMFFSIIAGPWVLALVVVLLTLPRSSRPVPVPEGLLSEVQALVALTRAFDPKDRITSEDATDAILVVVAAAYGSKP